MSEILYNKLHELENQKKSIEDEMKKIHHQLNKILENEKIEKYIKEQRRSVFEKFDVNTISDVCKSKRLCLILESIIEKHDIKTYERILIYLESNEIISRFIELLPSLLGLMLKYDWVDIIAMTNLFMRDNNIMIQKEEGYVNELLRHLRPIVRDCICDPETFYKMKEYRPKRIFTSLRTLI